MYPKKQTESDITMSIRQYLDMKGYWHVKVWQGMYSRIGIPDILGCTKEGKFFAIEVKKPGSNLTLRQKQVLDEITRIGGLAFVAYSIDNLIEHNL